MAKSADDLRRDQKAAADKMEKAAQSMAEAGDAAALATAQADFATAQAEFEATRTKVGAMEAAEQARAHAAVPANHAAQAVVTLPAQAANPEDKGVAVGLMVQALAMAKGDSERAAKILERDGHSGVSAALSGATEAAGGVTVPRPLATEIIGLLGAATVVRRAGAVSVPMPAGQIRNAKMLTGPTAAYIGENAAIAESEPTMGPVDQSFKTLTALVPIGNALLSHTGLQMARLVRDELVTALARREDLAFLRGNGSSNTPTGFRTWAAVGQWAGSAVAATAAAAEAAIRSALNRVEDKDVPMARGAWFMRAATKNFIASLRDVNGNFVFPSVQASGTLMGYPIYTTSQLPANLGAGTETEVFFAAMDQWMIGEDQSITIAMSTEASVVTGGVTTSAFQNDLTLMRAIARHDFAPKHTIAVAGFNGTAWTI